jgi:hypothetical protein
VSRVGEAIDGNVRIYLAGHTGLVSGAILRALPELRLGAKQPRRAHVPV